MESWLKAWEFIIVLVKDIVFFAESDKRQVFCHLRLSS